MVYVTEQFAEFVASARPERIPEHAKRAAETAILDTLASLIGGVPTDNARLTRDAALASFGPGSFKAWFSSAPAMHRLGALLSNCAAASALDVDDGHRGAAGHPGAAIVPAVLMEASELKVDGEAILSAVALGYDVALRIAEARHIDDDISYASGRWTGYGVAAALAWLRHRSAATITNAMAIAGAEAPQNLPQGACTTSSVKGSSPWSTVGAYVATARAEAGATGSIDLLNRQLVYDVASMTRDLGSRWLITETYIKPYASCRYTHPVIDAILALQGEDVANSSIDAIDVEIFPEAAKIPNNVVPTSLEDAQFSIPFTAALAALRGEEAFRPLKPSYLTDIAVLGLAKRVSISYPGEFAGVFPLGTPARVTLSLGNRRLSKEVAIPLGDYLNPLTRTQLERKLFDLGRNVVLQTELERLIAAINRFRQNGAADLLAELS